MGPFGSNISSWKFVLRATDAIGASPSVAAARFAPQTHRGVERQATSSGGRQGLLRHGWKHSREARIQTAPPQGGNRHRITDMRTHSDPVQTGIPHSSPFSVSRVHGTDGSPLQDAGTREGAPRKALSERHHGRCCARASNSSRPGS